jgi:hypothetical protein
MLNKIKVLKERCSSISSDQAQTFIEKHDLVIDELNTLFQRNIKSHCVDKLRKIFLDGFPNEELSYPDNFFSTAESEIRLHNHDAYEFAKIYIEFNHPDNNPLYTSMAETLISKYRIEIDIEQTYNYDKISDRFEIFVSNLNPEQWDLLLKLCELNETITLNNLYKPLVIVLGIPYFLEILPHLQKKGEFFNLLKSYDPSKIKNHYKMINDSVIRSYGSFKSIISNRKLVTGFSITSVLGFGIYLYSHGLSKTINYLDVARQMINALPEGQGFSGDLGLAINKNRQILGKVAHEVGSSASEIITKFWLGFFSTKIEMVKNLDKAIGKP